MAKYVINIDESDYETIKKIDKIGGTWDTSIVGRNMRAIANATPFEKVVEDVKAEFIAKYPKNYAGGLELNGRGCHFSLNTILAIIDKYREESGGNNGRR